MNALSILALEEIPKVGLKTISKFLSISPIFEPSSPADLIEVLKRTKSKFGRIAIPDVCSFCALGRSRQRISGKRKTE